MHQALPLGYITLQMQTPFKPKLKKKEGGGGGGGGLGSSNRSLLPEQTFPCFRVGNYCNPDALQEPSSLFLSSLSARSRREMLETKSSQEVRQETKLTERMKHRVV